MHCTSTFALAVAVTAFHVGTSVALPKTVSKTPKGGAKAALKYTPEETQAKFTNKAPSHEGVCRSIDDWNKKGATYPPKFIEHCQQYLVGQILKEEEGTQNSTSNGTPKKTAKKQRSFDENLWDLE